MSAVHSPKILLLLLILSGCAVSENKETGKVYWPQAGHPVGPMVGHVTPSTATIWAYAGAKVRMRVFYWKDGTPEARAQKADFPLLASEYDSAELARDGNLLRAWTSIENLEPATLYHYRLEVGEKKEVTPLWSVDGLPAPMVGSFTTPPADGTPARFSLAVTSCMRYWHPVQSSWYLLLAERPDLHLLLGDNVYTNTTDHNLIWKGHIRQRAAPEFATVIRHVPSYAIWDDHDYGPNDSDGTEPGKEHSLRAFKEVWANPGVGLDGVPGAFYKFSWGDVDFFMLDGRYHRIPKSAPDDEKKWMLGEEQFQWLERSLIESKAKFKVLASGSSLVHGGDGWMQYTHERKRLYSLIAEKKISGILYLSGDIHRSLLTVHPKSETGFYDLHEVVSSGIAASETRSFATLEFDTTLEDPTVRIRVIHGDGTIRHDQKVSLSNLQVGDRSRR